VRSMVYREFKWVVDPFDSHGSNKVAIQGTLPSNADSPVNPLRPADKLANSSRLLKVVAGIFSSLIAYTLNRFLAEKERKIALNRGISDENDSKLLDFFWVRN